MTPNDRILLEELKNLLKVKFQKSCVDVYLDKPTPEALVAKALQDLQRVIDEADRA